MQPVGINGFGRIGKAVFLLMLRHDSFYVAAINAPGLDINKIASYLKNDSVHKYNNDFEVEIIDNDNFKVNGQNVRIFRDKDAANLTWNDYNVQILIDATGAYLTQAKIGQHKVEKVIMTAPAKDDTPLFVYGANHDAYNGEQIVSNASCTTNCITPVLSFLEKKYNIVASNFTTIHAATSSQQVVDSANSLNRTCRSIFNNIIPHTTGASSSIYKVLPYMTGKITGTSVRVPVNNVSLVDLNVELKTSTTLKEILEAMSACPYIQLCHDGLVSSDFLTTTCPSIVDANACMELGRNNFKIMVWYDNEWSYSSQVVKMAEVMLNHKVASNFFIDNVELADKNVIVRLDLNVPVKDGVITSDHRVKSAVPTLRKIIESGAKRVIITSHFGRPDKRDEKHSLYKIVKVLEKHLGCAVGFLKDGLAAPTLEVMKNEEYRVYLLENVRFHKEETDATTIGPDNVANNVLQQLGDVYINDAFGCLHRSHLSITGVQCKERAYGYLIQKELSALKLITENPYKQKTLAIIGGAKIHDKLELLKELSRKVDTIYICGGNINALVKNDMASYYETISSNRAAIFVMEDGLVAKNFTDPPVVRNTHIVTDGVYDKGIADWMDVLQEDENFYDIGPKSIVTLHNLVLEHSIVFWNGTLGVVEEDKYKNGSVILMGLLHQSTNNNPDQKVIVGGGDTGGFVETFDKKYVDKLTHISTGGGASIEYITHNTLVGLTQFV